MNDYYDTHNVCDCGSRKHRYPLHDGHNIFLCYVCEECEQEKVSKYRIDIMERYECDEDIEEEE